MPAHSSVIPLKKGIHKYLYRSRIPSASLRAGKSGMINRKGFTLIELLIVISIIAVLSVIGITVFTGVQKGARDARRRGDIDSIVKAYEVKYNSTGSYGNSSIEGSYFASGSLPKDPKGADYTIYTDSSSGGVKICASLEDATPFCKSGTQAEPPQNGGSTTTLVSGTGISGIGNSIPMTGLQLWLKADAINGSDGSIVTSWPDASGSNTAVTILGSPTKQSSPNGKPVIRFLALTGSPQQNFKVTNNFPAPFSVIYVARMISGNSRILSGLSNNWLLGWWNGEMKTAYFEGFVNRGPGTNNNFHLFTGIGNGSVSSFFENGVQLASNSGGVQGPDGLTIGYGPANSEHSDTDIAEIIVYSQALSATDRNKVEQYLGSKYGIPITP